MNYLPKNKEISPNFAEVNFSNSKPQKLHKVKKITSITVILFLVLKIAISSTALFLPQTNAQAKTEEIKAKTLIELTNTEREKYNLTPLQTNTLLTQAAQNKASDIMQKDYFAHTTSEGKRFYQWIDEQNYNYQSAGENLAIDFTANKPIITAWLNSPTHRDNILDPNFQEIGIAVLTDEFKERQTTIVVQLFGQPAGRIAADNVSTTTALINADEPPLIMKKSEQETAIQQTVASIETTASPAPAPFWRSLIDKTDVLLNLIIALSAIALVILYLMTLKRKILLLHRFKH